MATVDSFEELEAKSRICRAWTLDTLPLKDKKKTMTNTVSLRQEY